jgi:hypothetical protein
MAAGITIPALFASMNVVFPDMKRPSNGLSGSLVSAEFPEHAPRE